MTDSWCRARFARVIHNPLKGSVDDDRHAQPHPSNHDEQPRSAGHPVGGRRAAGRGVGGRPALGRCQADLHRRGRRQAARHGRRRADAGPPRRGAAVEVVAHQEVRPVPGRHHRQSGGADGPRRPRGHLPVRLAGRGRRQPGRPDLPRPEPVPGQLRARSRPADQQRAAARRPDRPQHRQDRDRLPGADRGRRGGRLRRSAQRVRADEVDDRRRCRRCALGGPARVGEEVRPHGRQGADPDRAARSHAERRPAGRGHLRCPHPGHRPHRRARR